MATRYDLPPFSCVGPAGKAVIEPSEGGYVVSLYDWDHEFVVSHFVKGFDEAHTRMCKLAGND